MADFPETELGAIVMAAREVLGACDCRDCAEDLAEYLRDHGVVLGPAPEG